MEKLSEYVSANIILDKLVKRKCEYQHRRFPLSLKWKRKDYQYVQNRPEGKREKET